MMIQNVWKLYATQTLVLMAVLTFVLKTERASNSVMIFVPISMQVMGFVMKYAKTPKMGICFAKQSKHAKKIRINPSALSPAVIHQTKINFTVMPYVTYDQRLRIALKTTPPDLQFN
ncbi:hypothetical protein BGP77_06365 [Saccharospirillum sp. MSK14-1]|nr:hypothetical protein BGP77_06365 [Saccharospirillum sp. MSK14-1]